MRNIIMKELKLSSSCLSYLFILFGLMFFLPGYPVLCGVFFVTLGIFKSFQFSRENNDILFTALLPVSKRDVVKGKFVFVLIIELLSLILMGTAVALRMTVLSNVSAYVNNALMNANLFALGMAFLMFGLFNLIFLSGFFKTAYNFGRPFLIHIITTFVVIGIGEAAHYIPGFSFLNSFKMDNLGAQMILLSLGVILFLILTVLSYNISCKRFEKIDL